MRYDQADRPTIAVALSILVKLDRVAKKELVLWADPLVSTASAGAMIPRDNHDPAVECHGATVLLHHEVGNETQITADCEYILYGK